MHHFLSLQSSRLSSSIPRTIYCRMSGRLERSAASHQRATYLIQRQREIIVLYLFPLLLACHPSQGRFALPYLVVLPNHKLYLHSFQLLVYAPPTHRYSLESRLLATNQIDNFSLVQFCVYRIRSILFFILSYPLTSLSIIWFVVGRFCILCPKYLSCEPFPCDFYSTPCTLSAHSSSSLLQQSLYHIEHCPRLQLPSEVPKGVYIILLVCP